MKKQNKKILGWIGAIVAVIILAHFAGLLSIAGLNLGQWHTATWDGKDLVIPISVGVPRDNSGQVFLEKDPNIGNKGLNPITPEQCSAIGFEYDITPISSPDGCVWNYNKISSKSIDSTLVCDGAITNPTVHFDGTYITWESDGKAENCNGEVRIHIVPTMQTYYRFDSINNLCAQISLMSSDRTTNDYLSSSDCLANIIAKKTVYRFQNNSCSAVTLYNSQTQTNDYSSLDLCQNNVISAPTSIQSPSFNSIIQKIFDWFNSLFAALKTLTISGEVSPLAGTQQTYTINIVAPSIPQSDYSKGNYQIQYANWALVDSSGNNIKQQGTWETVNGTYSKTISITVPSDVNSYAILGVINQDDLVYNFTNKNWSTVKDAVVAKEAYNINTKLPMPVVNAPTSSKFLDIINAIINWFKSLFGV